MSNTDDIWWPLTEHSLWDGDITSTPFYDPARKVGPPLIEEDAGAQRGQVTGLRPHS